MIVYLSNGGASVQVVLMIDLKCTTGFFSQIFIWLATLSVLNLYYIGDLCLEPIYPFQAVAVL